VAIRPSGSRQPRRGVASARCWPSSARLEAAPRSALPAGRRACFDSGAAPARGSRTIVGWRSKIRRLNDFAKTTLNSPAWCSRRISFGNAASRINDPWSCEPSGLLDRSTKLLEAEGRRAGERMGSHRFECAGTLRRSSPLMRRRQRGSARARGEKKGLLGWRTMRGEPAARRRTNGAFKVIALLLAWNVAR